MTAISPAISPAAAPIRRLHRTRRAARLTARAGVLGSLGYVAVSFGSLVGALWLLATDDPERGSIDHLIDSTVD